MNKQIHRKNRKIQKETKIHMRIEHVIEMAFQVSKKKIDYSINSIRSVK